MTDLFRTSPKGLVSCMPSMKTQSRFCSDMLRLPSAPFGLFDVERAIDQLRALEPMDNLSATRELVDWARGMMVRG